jgi:hypothetical protein
MLGSLYDTCLHAPQVLTPEQNRELLEGPILEALIRVCVYVCAYVCMCVCVYIYTYIYNRYGTIYIHTHTHIP